MSDKVDKFWIVVPAKQILNTGLDGQKEAREALERHSQKKAMKLAGQRALENKAPYVIMEAVNVADPKTTIEWEQPAVSNQNGPESDA